MNTRSRISTKKRRYSSRLHIYLFYYNLMTDQPKPKRTLPLQETALKY